MKYKKGTLSRDGFYTKSISERLWFAPTIWFFLQIVSMSMQDGWPWKSRLLCVASHLIHQTASQDFLLQKTPLPSDLNSDVCSQKSGSDPENLQNLAKVRDREIFARSAIFSKLFTIPTCLPYQLFSSMVELPCANSISLLLFCAEVLYCSKIFFLFLNEHRVGCSWCQPYRRYFFCIYMCISLFMKDIFGRTWHQPHCLYFFWFLQVWAADASAKLPYTWLASWISREVLLRSLHLYLYLHLYLQILWHSHNADPAKGPSWDTLDH